MTFFYNSGGYFVLDKDVGHCYMCKSSQTALTDTTANSRYSTYQVTFDNEAPPSTITVAATG